MAGDGENGTQADGIRTLVEAYAMAADQRDAGWFCSLWLPSATLRIFDGENRMTGIYEGAEAMAGVTEALRRYVRTVHLVSTHHHVIDDTDGSASGHTYCTAHHLVAAGEHAGASTTTCEDHVMTIRYDDAYRRDDAGAWRFAGRECHKLWVRTESVTLFDDADRADGAS